MNKNELRKLLIDKRNSLKGIAEKSAIINQKVIKLKEFNKAKVVAFYYPIKNEVNTLLLFDYALKHNIITCFPKVINETTMYFYKINNLSELENGKFNIYEPSENIKNLVNPNEIDCFLIPLVGFDKSLNRIGYGKGYYDRYLRLNLKAFKIGLAYKEQEINESINDINSNDIKLDIVVTD